MYTQHQLFEAQVTIVVFGIVCLIPWVFEKNRQVFQPIKTWATLQLLLVVPGAIMVLREPNLLHPDVLLSIEGNVAVGLRNGMGMFTLCNLAFFVAYYLSIGSTRKQRNILPGTPVLTKFDSSSIIFVTVGLGIAGFLLKLWLAGGLEYLMSNVSNRVGIQRGLGPLNYFIEAAFLIALVAATKRHAIINSQFTFWSLILVIMIVAATSSVFGGRKTTLQFLLSAFILISIFKPNSFNLNLGTIISAVAMYACIFFYFFAVLTYRNMSDLAEFNSAAPELFNMAINSMGHIFVQMSYLDTYVFIVAHFDSSNYYYGATFSDLQTAFLPSSWVPDKPAVDDGVFVRQSSLGFRLEPGTPALELVGYAAWPPETVGAAYMNGGVIWVVVAGALLGGILARGYLFATRHPNSVVGLIVMLNLFLNFEISNLRIVTLLTILVVSLVLVFLLRNTIAIVPRRRRSERKLKVRL